MKVLHAVNYHRFTWGSDRAWDGTIQLSRENGIDAVVFSRDSKALSQSVRGRARAFIGGIYASEGVRAFQAALDRVRPDVVHTHELYPLISPWILPRCSAAGVPVVQSAYDFRLTCPITTHFVHGKVCRECMGGTRIPSGVQQLPRQCGGERWLCLTQHGGAQVAAVS